MAFQATEQDRKEFDEIMNSDKLARDYWAAHLMHLCALNDASNRFIKAIDALCDTKRLLDPIDVKRLLKKMTQEKVELAKSVHFGLKALE